MAVIEQSIEIAAPVHAVFAFHADPQNIQRVTPPGVRMEFVRADLPLEVGSEIELAFHVGPISLQWISKITVFDNNERFVDEQIKGPYRTWVHSHLFKAVDEDTTLLIDRVEFRQPLGPLGRMGSRMMLGMSMEDIFRHRQIKTKEWIEENLKDFLGKN